jgi:hypothetical protein
MPKPYKPTQKRAVTNDSTTSGQRLRGQEMLNYFTSHAQKNEASEQATQPLHDLMSQPYADTLPDMYIPDAHPLF